MKLVLLLACITLVLGDAWNTYNDPSTFGVSQYSLSKLTTSAALKQKPWSDTYWPSFQSGIAHRWNSKTPQDFSYSLYTKTQLKNMSLRQLSQLSPAEKYDLYMARYDFPTVKTEWQRTSPQDARWEGICHGWAPAAIYYEQPSAVNMVNKDNITVPFGSSDVKALLSYFTAEYDEQNQDTLFVAQRCNTDLSQNPPAQNYPECKDLNAGALHVLFANLIQSQSGFVYDRDRSIQVWNQPIYSIQSTLGATRAPSQGSAPGTKKEQNIVSLVTYVKETVPSWDAHDPYLITENYTYWVELDGTGKILGGSHVTWDRPDFMWMVGFGSFTGYFSGLTQIYPASINNTNQHEYIETDVLTPSIEAEKLEESKGTISFEFSGDDSRSRIYKHRWAIEPKFKSTDCSGLNLRFQEFSTERYRQKVKIYEGSNGEGPLLAVFHGHQLPNELSLETCGALVVFASETNEKGAKFALEYSTF